MKRAAVLLLLALAVGAVSAGQALSGRVVAVLDGDTLTLLDSGNRQHRIRLAQIDAPEIGHGAKDPGQPFGKASKQSLSELAYGREARADCETTDKYGRQECTVWVDRTNVNLEQVRRGMAWVYRRYAHDAAYYEAESDARQAKRGLWRSSGQIPPWEYRHHGK